MLLGNLNLLKTDPLRFLQSLVVVACAVLIAITVHEFSHAAMAYKLGDTTAQRNGRLSLNPAAHLEALGAIMLLVVGFGWGKPVPVNPYYLKYGPRKGMALVAFAGPLSNLLLGAVAGLTARFAPLPERTLDLIATVMVISIMLALFNLIPLPPLDGSNIALAILPRKMALSYARIQPYGMFILIGIVLLDSLAHVNILGAVLNPPINFFANLYLGQPVL